MLTQFFLDNNNVATGVKTFVIDNAIGHNAVNMTSMDNYTKKLCNVPHLMNLEYVPTPVMFILCHGSARSAALETPYLGFSEESGSNMLYPCSGFSPTIWMQHVICNTKLVFLMCCNCDQIVPAYLEGRKNDQIKYEGRKRDRPYDNDSTDIVYFNCGTIMQITHAIFVGWLIKMMDSVDVIGSNPSAEALHHGVKQSVAKIMSMVSQCKDKDKFFDNLIEWGCISKYTTEKEKEEQELPEWRFNNPGIMQNFYRVYGHTRNEWILDDAKELLYNEFKALTLLERGGTTHKITTHKDFTKQDMQNTDNMYTLLSQLNAMSGFY